MATKRKTASKRRSVSKTVVKKAAAPSKRRAAPSKRRAVPSKRRAAPSKRR